MRAYDVSFEISAGTKYGFVLAVAAGRKAWEVTRLYTKPPTLIKQRIDMVITASEDDITASGARQLRRMAKILADLEVLMTETDNITLTGLDNESYQVLLDKEGLTIKTLIHEKSKEPEYQVSLLCWGLYT